MAVPQVTYTYIEAGGAAPVCGRRTLKADGEAYLWGHVEGLLKRARAGTSPPASFRTTAAAERFEHLASGDEEQFLAAAQSIAVDVHKLMDQRTNPGLLLAANITRPHEDAVVVVLKLEVEEKFAGVLKEEVAAGGPALEIVRNHLTGAQDLQKGAVFPDPREDDSDVVVGDKLGDTADYFLRGLGIAQMTKPVQAATELFKVVLTRAPERADALARRLEASEISTVAELLDASADILSPEELQDLRTAAQDRDRPIQKFDPQRARHGKRIVRAGGITIRGSLQDMDAVQVAPIAGGRWRITIETDFEPHISYEFR